MSEPWKIRGELVLSCNCEVFCPCVVSLGKHAPTYGTCHTWWGLHIEEGRAGDEPLDGLNVAMVLDVPGPLVEGKWTMGIYIDERASERASESLTAILSGHAGGPTGWFSIMTANYLGVKQVPIRFERKRRGWHFEIPKIIDGGVEPVEGADGTATTTVNNTRYWMAPTVVVCQSTRSRFRDWGRNWDLSGCSGEYARVNWKGP
jgi:hypothetical protein